MVPTLKVINARAVILRMAWTLVRKMVRVMIVVRAVFTQRTTVRLRIRMNALQLAMTFARMVPIQDREMVETTNAQALQEATNVPTAQMPKMSAPGIRGACMTHVLVAGRRLTIAARWARAARLLMIIAWLERTVTSASHKAMKMSVQRESPLRMYAMTLIPMNV